MKLQPMSFKDYVWPMNPETIRVEYARNLREIKLPLSGSVLQDMGCGKRVVSGTGQFIGSDCMEEFTRLEALFAEGGSGTLRLPGAQSFSAAFASLKLAGKAGPDSVGYEFVFMEDSPGSAGSGASGTGIYTCTGGETLWGIANRFGTTVDRLRALNPIIQWPNSLEQGRKVVLP